MLTKLVTKDLKSKYGDVSWKVGETVSIPVARRSSWICTPGLLHVYEGSPELAVLLDPIHAGIGPTARCLEVEGEVVVREGQLKAAAHELKILRELPLPVMSVEIAVRFAIYCAQAVVKKGSIPIWEKWATNWLSGKDRTSEAAEEAAWEAEEAAEAAEAEAAEVEAEVEMKARAAWAAGVAAKAARAEAARVAAKAAAAEEAAWEAEEAAEEAAVAAARTATRVAAKAAGVVTLDLNALALKAFNEEEEV